MLRPVSRLISRIGSSFSSITTEADQRTVVMAADDLFPSPKGLPVHSMSPTPWPGGDFDSTEALLDVLKDNHERWYIFSNIGEGFHNHITHHALALWFLGAPKEIIKSAYKVDSEDQTPIFDSPEAINSDNFNEHLGDKKFYKSYLEFFTKVVKDIGPNEALIQYLFPPVRNWGSTDKSGQNHPQMLNRFVSGLLHPLIHTGYGFEYNLPGMVIEGLAETAVHTATATPLLPVALWHEHWHGQKLKSTIHSVSKELDPTTGAHPEPNGKGLHAFAILAQMLKDDSLKLKERRTDGTYAGGQFYRGVLEEMGDKIYDYTKQWAVEGTWPTIEGKIEELQWMNTILYGCCGFNGEDQDFQANFFLMHLVTSSIFLPSLLKGLPEEPALLLLSSYFSTSVAWWVSRGRPKPKIRELFAATSTQYPLPSDHEKYPPLQDWYLPGPPTSTSQFPNPWLNIIQKTIPHPDDHLPKLQRTLAHYGRIYGHIKKGYWEATGLEGEEELDGTLFIRAAGLTDKRMGRVSDKAPFWDRQNWFTEDS